MIPYVDDRHMERSGRHDRRSKRRNRDPQSQSMAKKVLAFVGTLVATSLSLVGGVLIGGWIAFETPNWRAFRSFIEGMTIGTGQSVGIMLFLIAVGIGLVTTITYSN